jgi:hypothetical protein
MNGKLRRNKQKALAFVPVTAHYFCIISSNLTERAEAYVSGRFLCFVSLSPQRNEKGKLVFIPPNHYICFCQNPSNHENHQSARQIFQRDIFAQRGDGSLIERNAPRRVKEKYRF